MASRHRIAVIALSLCACAADPDAAPAPAAPPVRPVAAGPTTVPTVAPPPHSTIRLLDPGAAPRHRVRYAPAPGSRHTCLIEDSFSMAMVADGTPMFSQSGAAKVSIEFLVESVSAQRQHLAVHLLDISIPNFTPGPIAEPREKPKDARGKLVVDDRGRVVSFDLPFLESNPEFADYLAVRDYLALLPEEPIGVGARWEVEVTVVRNGMTMTMTETHTVTRVSADELTTDYVLRAAAGDQVVPLPGRRELSVFELGAFSSTGKGTFELSMARPVPVRSHVEFTFAARLNVRGPEFTQGVDMTMTNAADNRSESR